MITITKDKIYRSTFSLKETKPNSETVEEIGVEDIIFSLGEEVELGEDVTFQRLFDIILFHKEFFNILYHTEMNGVMVDDFIMDYEKKFDLEVSPYQEYRLMISWSTSVYEINHEIEYYDFPLFEAFGKLDNRIDGEEYPISVSFSSLSEFKNKLVILNNVFEIQNQDSHENEIEASFKANYRPFLLNDVFSSILTEVAQYGAPSERDLARKEMEIRGHEITQMIEDGSIMEHIVSDEDLRKELREMVDEEHDDKDNITFWDVLYPKEKPIGKSSKEMVDDAIIALSEGVDLSLEEQMREAHEAEEYEKAAKIKKLIEKRDQNKNGKI
ncbi:MAG: hypothetical protein AABY15_01955 [Nanoarchaeota archaeon]